VASASDRNPIIIGGLPSQVPDFDPEETQEWLDSLDAAVDERGRERARYLMLRLIERAREKRVAVPEMRSTDYVNTIPTRAEPFFPGNEEIERSHDLHHEPPRCRVAFPTTGNAQKSKTLGYRKFPVSTPSSPGDGFKL
jgi:hypothetical protein